MTTRHRTDNVSSNARESYLATQVTTATPQKLHLMLIDGAIRSGQRARQAWQDGNDEAAGDALVRCQEIVGELLASVAGAKSDLGRKLGGIYLFLFRTLTKVHLNRDQQKLDEVLQILEIEQETWRQLCQKFGAVIHGPHAGPAPAAGISFEG